MKKLMQKLVCVFLVLSSVNLVGATASSLPAAPEVPGAGISAPVVNGGDNNQPPTPRPKAPSQYWNAKLAATVAGALSYFMLLAASYGKYGYNELNGVAVGAEILPFGILAAILFGSYYDNTLAAPNNLALGLDAALTAAQLAGLYTGVSGAIFKTTGDGEANGLLLSSYGLTGGTALGNLAMIGFMGALQVWKSCKAKAEAPVTAQPPAPSQAPVVAQSV